MPDDVRLYLEYREHVLPRLQQAAVIVEEPDIMVAFLLDRDLPAPGTRNELRNFVQDIAAFDLSPILRQLHSRIVNPDGGTSYYRILEEFARLPRSMWREFKSRLVICLDANKARKPQRPFRFAFPRSDCTFMIASMDPDWPATGADGNRMRNNALVMFTEAAKYDLKTQVGVGVLISKDGEHVHVDWCFLDESWVPSARIDELLATGLFGTAREKQSNSFLFQE